jgi:HSP20 family molecular chaperone IbpA
MKGNKGFLDLGTIFDDIFQAAQDFRDELGINFDQYGHPFPPHGSFQGHSAFDENVDYYPAYSYPPMNVCISSDRSLVFEFALAGFAEDDINLSFQGDYMVFSAKLGTDFTCRDVSPSADNAAGNDAASVAEDYSFRNRAADETSDSGFHYFKRRLKLKDIDKQKYFVPQDKYAQENVRAVFKNGILKVTVPPKVDVNKNDGIKIKIFREGE